MLQPPLAVLIANNNGVVVFLMERGVRWSVSLTSNAYYWQSYDNRGEESINRIPPLKKSYILVDSKCRKKTYASRLPEIKKRIMLFGAKDSQICKNDYALRPSEIKKRTFCRLGKYKTSRRSPVTGHITNLSFMV